MDSPHGLVVTDAMKQAALALAHCYNDWLEASKQRATQSRNVLENPEIGVSPRGAHQTALKATEHTKLSAARVALKDTASEVNRAILDAQPNRTVREALLHQTLNQLTLRTALEHGLPSPHEGRYYGAQLGPTAEK